VRGAAGPSSQAPDERSTAQPPRDFYVYILPPFQLASARPAASYEPLTDEVLLALHGLDADFETMVRRYAGARVLANTASEHRQAYEDKAEASLRQLLRWLREHLAGRLQITHRGATRSTAQVLAQTCSSVSRDPKELLDVIAANLLAPGFGDAYPDYPRFSWLAQPISEAGRPAGAVDAIRMIALRVQQMLQDVAALQPAAAYLSEALASLPEEHPWAERSRAGRDELLAGLRRLARGEASFDRAGWQRRLEGLRQEYVRAYGELHRQYVLGPADDGRRTRIMGDARVAQLRDLATIDILSNAERDGWIQAISGIRTCREFHEGLLADAPTCRCGFRPVQVAGGLAAGRQLELLDERLDTILAQWHAALVDALRSETAQHSIAAMTAQERQPLEVYLALPDPAGASLPAGLAQVANQALRGIDTVSLAVDELVEALKAGGLPCTVEQLNQRFANHVTAAMSGRDARTTRLTLAE
jgi:hypothetical protein